MSSSTVRCRLNGVQHNIVEIGSGDPLLFLHGFTGSGSDWMPIMRSLSGKYRCIAPDLLGHGQTEAPPDWRCYSMENATADMLSLLAQLSIDSATVIGYSMGGRLALHIACAAPESVRALVLEGASPGLRTEDERDSRAHTDDALADYITEAGVAAFVDRWESLPLFASQRRLSETQRNALRHNRLQHSATGLACSVRGMSPGRQPCLWPQLRLLHVPILLLAGAEDTKFQGIAAAMHEQMANSTLELIPKAGHNTHLEQPDAYLAAIYAFLTDNKATLP